MNLAQTVSNHLNPKGQDSITYNSDLAEDVESFMHLTLAQKDEAALKILIELTKTVPLLHANVLKGAHFEAIFRCNWSPGLDLLFNVALQCHHAVCPAVVQGSTTTPFFDAIVEKVWQHSETIKDASPTSSLHQRECLEWLALAALDTNRPDIFERCLNATTWAGDPVTLRTIYKKLEQRVIETGHLWALDLAMQHQRRHPRTNCLISSSNIWTHLLKKAPFSVLKEWVDIQDKHHALTCSNFHTIFNISELFTGLNSENVYHIARYIEERPNTKKWPEHERTRAQMLIFAAHLHTQGKISAADAHDWYNKGVKRGFIVSPFAQVVAVCLRSKNMAPLAYLSTIHPKYYQTEMMNYCGQTEMMAYCSQKDMMKQNGSRLDQLIGITEHSDRVLAQSGLSSPQLEILRQRITLQDATCNAVATRAEHFAKKKM